MKANKILLGLALSLSALTACSSGQSEQSAQDSTTQPSASVVANPDSLPYHIAKNYFAAEDSLPATLTSEEELNRHLGMATTMADKPTEIDWQREFVIPVVLPATTISTEILPVRLKKDSEGNLVLTYKVQRGEDMKTAEIRPFTAIIVSRDFLAPVRLAEANYPPYSLRNRACAAPLPSLRERGCVHLYSRLSVGQSQSV